jgi:2'-5' RNA ligase
VTEDEVKSVFEGFTGSINIEVDGIGVFENKDYDVVKFNVNPDGSLQELHDKLSEFPNSNSFPDYKPHITLAYIKKGLGKKYIRNDYKYTVKNVDKITIQCQVVRKFTSNTIKV